MEKSASKRPRRKLTVTAESDVTPGVRPTGEATHTPVARDRRQRVQAAETSVAVLKGLARLGGRATLTALAAGVQENPAKVHRYLISLIEEGMVLQDANTQQYYLGTDALLIGIAAMRQADPVRAAEAALVRLRESLDLTCFVAVMGNVGPTILRIEEPSLPVIVNVRAGSVLPMLWSATGRVFLAWLDDAAAHTLALRELEASKGDSRLNLRSKDPVQELRDSVRHAGCAIVRDTNLIGISSVSAPIFNSSGRLCAAITVLGATGAFDLDPSAEVATALRNESVATSRQLGFQPHSG